MSRLNGKIALVTGGNSGIGFAIAQRFVAEGAFVFIVGRRKAQLQEAVAALGDAAHPIEADLTDSHALKRVFEVIREHKGKLDVLVANSGVAVPLALEDSTEAHIDQIFDLNARAVALCVREALPLLGNGASVVLTGSIAGSIGTPGYGSYGASKAAVRAYARTWANELAGRGIRVNTLSPGPIDTPMFEQVSEEVKKSVVALVPMGRLGRPEEVAAAALFLASDESSYVTGAELCVDGGTAQV